MKKKCGNYIRSIIKNIMQLCKNENITYNYNETLLQ